MSPVKTSRRRAAGFTLVEILVVMTLLSLLMLALGSAMRTIAQTEERVDTRLHRADEMRVAANFLSSTLGRISARRSQTPTQVGASLFLFSGLPGEVTWVGVMPARYGAGGRHFFRLGLEPTAQGSNLVIRFSPWNGVAEFPDWSQAQSRVMVENVTALGLEYSGEDVSSGAWLPTWIVPQRLPGRIRLSIRTAAVDWPQITVPMRQLPGSDSGMGGFTLGPS
jgi:general secretion pathway protein J